MTATPIPRTLALTECGDMDVSVIRGLPPGRKPVRTLVKSDARRDEVYQLLREQLKQGRQAYVIYPLVEESEKIDLKAATAMAEELTQVFPEFRVALLHGRMKGDEKERVMRAFVAGTLQLLVSTTVVEVGVDVPNATVMVVEHAERFGLSQLHQLRGRIGRGAHDSTCVLLYQAPWSDDARERLKAMSDTNDGFVIAERDLQAARPRRFLRDAAVRPAATARRRPDARRRPARARLRRGAGPRRAGPTDAGTAGLRARRVAAAVRPDYRRVRR